MILDIEENGFRVNAWEIGNAIMTTNPNKAIGIDNISLKPLDHKEVLAMQYKGQKYEEYKRDTNNPMTKS